MAHVHYCTRACQTMTACFCSSSIRYCAHRLTSRSQISPLHLSGWLSSTILIRQALDSIALRLSQSQIQHPHRHALICYSYLSCQHRSLFLTQQKCFRSGRKPNDPSFVRTVALWSKFAIAYGTFTNILGDGNRRWPPADGNQGDFFFLKEENLSLADGSNEELLAFSLCLWSPWSSVEKASGWSGFPLSWICVSSCRWFSTASRRGF